MIGLIAFYTSIVLGFLAFENGVFESDKIVEWIVECGELIMLTIFLFEILTKIIIY